MVQVVNCQQLYSPTCLNEVQRSFKINFLCNKSMAREKCIILHLYLLMATMTHLINSGDKFNRNCRGSISGNGRCVCINGEDDDLMLHNFAVWLAGAPLLTKLVSCWLQKSWNYDISPMIMESNYHLNPHYSHMRHIRHGKIQLEWIHISSWQNAFCDLQNTLWDSWWNFVTLDMALQTIEFLMSTSASPLF